MSTLFNFYCRYSTIFWNVMDTCHFAPFRVDTAPKARTLVTYLHNLPLFLIFGVIVYNAETRVISNGEVLSFVLSYRQFIVFFLLIAMPLV